MKKMTLIIFLFFSWLVNAQQKEVRNSIETFFNAFHQKDTSEIRKLCSDKIILQSISESKSKGNKLSDENLKEFLLSIATIPIETKFKEKILNYTIQIDGSMAHVWAPNFISMIN
ncbi:nuclear transport factor 2 family protein [Flavobacterium hercynium]|uniref:nuclear transport factor 2 family protein n=1 Tax=Flavobacterium hercynium TaxID=387094 RepID=UPI001FCBF4C1|nr:nuclear transport factor 2 family protein [Flavobacterium hercynium]SMP37488.1 hypothetical protein SAMN06265346_1342 [Flavobacterium hercynium]